MRAARELPRARSKNQKDGHEGTKDTKDTKKGKQKMDYRLRGSDDVTNRFDLVLVLTLSVFFVPSWHSFDPILFANGSA